MIYIGDDGSKEGNDYPAFQAVGFKHAVLVARKFLQSMIQVLRPRMSADYCKAPKNFWKITYQRIRVNKGCLNI
jgi:hypothetical protein